MTTLEGQAELDALETEDVTDEEAEDWSIVEEMPSVVRGMTPKLEGLATQAATDLKPRQGPLTKDRKDDILAMKRWLHSFGYTIRYREGNGLLTWKVLQLRERPPMTEEHKAKIVAARKASAATRKAARAHSSGEVAQ